MSTLRIQGLVRTFARVREHLQQGIAPGEAAAFRRQVREVVAQVEQICRAHRTRPDQLPAPSRAAYRFLKDLDLNHLPTRADQPPDAPAAPATGFRVKNLSTLEQRFAGRMWGQLSNLRGDAALRAELRGEIACQAALVDAICAQQRATPAVLAGPSRQVYCWLTFLSDEANLALHLAALQRARAAVGAHEPAVELHLVHMSSLWRVRRAPETVLLKVSEGFLHAEQEVWGALVGASVGARPQAHQPSLRAFAESEDFTAVLIELASYADPPSPAARGRVHDLEASYARVNQTYFGGALPKPRLAWSRTLTMAKFGHYQAGGDIVMLSASLDDPRVPAPVVDFVMYHELLHKQLGVTIAGGRRQMHTAAFRAAERCFADFDAVKRQLDELARRHRSRRLA